MKKENSTKSNFKIIIQNAIIMIITIILITATGKYFFF
jgi:hypothetical protein